MTLSYAAESYTGAIGGLAELNSNKIESLGLSMMNIVLPSALQSLDSIEIGYFTVDDKTNQLYFKAFTPDELLASEQIIDAFAFYITLMIPPTISHIGDDALRMMGLIGNVIPTYSTSVSKNGRDIEYGGLQ